SNPDGQLENLAEFVSLLKQQLVTPGKYAAYADQLPQETAAEKLDKQKHKELAGFFKTYLNLCRREQLIDYDDQIYLAIELLESRPNILKTMQDRYHYLLVDEFQDTNPMQSKLVDLLAGKSQNIMVVGDDDQSIYGWRGATLANILDFKARYPKATEVALIENYRSTQGILDAAYRLIQANNPHRLEIISKLDKRLHGQQAGPEPQLQHFTSYEAELAWIAEDIKKRLQAKQPAGSIAVLARRNQAVQKLHEAFELYDLPHVVAGVDNDIYQQPAVRQLIEALKCVADPNDDLALFHLLSGPVFRLDVGQLANLSGQARRSHSSLAKIIEEQADPELEQTMKQISEWRQVSAEQSVGSLAYSIMRDSGWMQRLYQESSDDQAVFAEVQALSKLFRTLKEFERVSGAASVQQYIVNLPVLQAAGNQFDDGTLDISEEKVNVLSVHRAKGLEWRTVYIVDCTEGSFPLKSFGTSLRLPLELQASPSEADDHLAEERRLMYVAITRGQQEVILSYSDRHGSGGARKPSRFLAELLGHEPTATAADEASQTSLELFAPTNPAGTAAIPEAMQRDGRFFLSVSQIETWLRCPQDFYFRYVLNMPLPPAPQLDYGSLIHEVIEQVHQGRQNGNVPSLEALSDAVRKALPKSGYVSKQSRERAHIQALKTVETVYERFLKDDLPIETEWPFSLEVPDLPLTIKGKIDAVYQLEKGVEIRDFKTGTSITTPEKAKSRVAGSQQLTLYALAWLQLRGEMPAKLTLDFVETGQLSSIKKQPKSLTTLHAKLRLMVDQLLAGQYPMGRDHSRCMHPTDN
ncbi:MAG TPA: ATP-dependent DNA helicase, partial [Candidatus Saccharimonadales bacterium]|nr:ATP-dependent DNA helicase [Candidatus Saccharimonadales bacterium]